MLKHLRKPINILLVSCLIGFILRIYLAHFLTHYGDLLTFKAWAFNISAHGPNYFYSNFWSDYLPGYLYILWGLGSISNLLANFHIIIPDEILFKLPSIIADILSAYFIYLILKKVINVKSALIGAIIYIFNPAVLSNSTFWGQADSFMFFFLISSFYYLIQGRNWLSAILIGIGQIVKPIAVLSLPLYILYLLHQKKGLKKSVIFLIFFSSVIIAGFIPFSNQFNIFGFAIDRHLATANQYPYTTLNAFNFWSIVTQFWYPDSKILLGTSLHNIGIFLFGLIYFVLISIVLIRLRKESNSILLLIYALSLTYLGMFLFLTRMHERHMFYGIAFLALLFPLSFNNKIVGSILYINYSINLYFAYAQLNSKPTPFDYNWVLIFSLLNVCSFIKLFVAFLNTKTKK